MDAAARAVSRFEHMNVVAEGKEVLGGSNASEAGAKDEDGAREGVVSARGTWLAEIDIAEGREKGPSSGGEGSDGVGNGGESLALGEAGSGICPPAGQDVVARDKIVTLLPRAK